MLELTVIVLEDQRLTLQSDVTIRALLPKSLPLRSSSSTALPESVNGLWSLLPKRMPMAPLASSSVRTMSMSPSSSTRAHRAPLATIALVPNEEIKKVFEPDFALSYTVTLHKTGALETSLKVINPSPTAVLRFQTLLHTYLRLPEGLQPIDVAVRGLEGLSYADKVGGGVQTQGADEPIKFEDEVDRVYFDAPNSASLVDLKNGRKFLDVQKNNFDTYTVWNPHKAKSDGELPTCVRMCIGEVADAFGWVNSTGRHGG